MVIGWSCASSVRFLVRIAHMMQAKFQLHTVSGKAEPVIWQGKLTFLGTRPTPLGYPKGRLARCF